MCCEVFRDVFQAEIVLCQEASAAFVLQRLSPKPRTGPLSFNGWT